MVLNRGLALKNILTVAKKYQGGVGIQSIRHSGGEYAYRAPIVPRKQNLLYAEIAGAFMWWWIIHHTLTQPGHLIGEFPYPDPSKWTDEELGIPPDNE